MEGTFIIMPILMSFALSAAAGPLMIPILRQLKIGQTVREEGPKSHLLKSGTPTMGGLLILISVTVISLLYARDYPDTLPVLFLTVGFGLIGFIDDFLKVVLRRSMGLSPLQKMSLQLIVTGAFAYYMKELSEVSLLMRIPFFKGYYVDLGAFTIPMMFLVVLGTVNGTNFTDGLDGLLSSVTIMASTFMTVVAVGLQAGIYPVTCAVVGALLGFLMFNVHPASVFMGDTGSLALGGFLVSCAYMMQMPLYLPIIGAVYVAEVLSVIIQVTYFKISGGRRVFKMAPLHHHFELCGYSETRIVAAFSIITALLCLLALRGIA